MKAEYNTDLSTALKLPRIPSKAPKTRGKTPADVRLIERDQARYIEKVLLKPHVR